MECQICKSSNIVHVISLGHQPPSDEFIPLEKTKKPFTVYPLDLLYCKDCGLVQLGYTVDPNILFKEYAYNTGSNKQLKQQFCELTATLIKKYNLTNKDLAVDIGSNDGTLLEGYMKNGVKVLGIDPSSVTSIAIEKGIPTIVDFFNKETAKKAKEKYGTAKIITGTNMFAHVDALDSLMQGVVMLLDKKGVFVTESHHLLNLVTKLQYDQIYHEHLRYYSAKPLMHLFKNYGMEIIDIEYVASHGGSIRVYAVFKGEYEVQSSVQKVIDEETEAGLYNPTTYAEFADRILQSKHKLLELLIRLRKEGKEVVGLGAPAKGNTLLNYCQIRSDLVNYLAEHTDLKIGLYAPGSLIPVVDEVRIFKEQPPYLLLLAWNLKDILIPKMRDKGFKGKFIIPGEKPIIE